MAEHSISHWFSRCRQGLARRRSALAARLTGRGGSFEYHPAPAETAPPRLWLRTPASVEPEVARAWCQHRWWVEVADDGLPDELLAPWFYAPGGTLPPLDPAHLAGALMVALAEEVDAVFLAPDGPTAAKAIQDLGATEIDHPEVRRWMLFSHRAYGYDPASDRVAPRGGTGSGRPRRIKVVPAAGAQVVPGSYPEDDRRRRGPYRADDDLPPRLSVGLRDVVTLPGVETQPTTEDFADTAKPLLVTTSFLARGGAEHTLFETLRALRPRIAPVIVTLAPHRPELGDRREDFRQLDIPIFCLGDWVHPAAMPGLLSALVTSLGAPTLYNANGTTLFYDFLPRLRRDHPTLRILDHLYDHRVGYIERYDPSIRQLLDACVAENHRIQQTLVEDYGWSADKAPVIWPCGRADDAFAPVTDRPALRQRLRAELGIADETLLVLTAARMHAQKRPLDLVALARRLRGRPVHFLVVGGGDLESAVDEAIAQAAAEPEGPAPITHLGFRTDIPDLLVAADVGCLVSEYEGLPVFLLESLQLGRPFLGTDVGELGRVLRETDAGPVVEHPGDLDALVEAVEALLDPEQRARFAERAAKAGPHFGVSPCAERYERVFWALPLDPEADSSPGAAAS